MTTNEKAIQLETCDYSFLHRNGIKSCAGLGESCFRWEYTKLRLSFGGDYGLAVGLLFLGFALFFDVSSFQGRHDFSFLTYYGNGFFSALVWAVLAGFIFRRKSIADKNADTEK